MSEDEDVHGSGLHLLLLVVKHRVEGEIRSAISWQEAGSWGGSRLQERHFSHVQPLRQSFKEWYFLLLRYMYLSHYCHIISFVCFSDFCTLISFNSEHNFEHIRKVWNHYVVFSMTLNVDICYHIFIENLGHWAGHKNVTSPIVSST